MSSKYVRDTFKNWLETEFPTENVLDLTAEFSSIQHLLRDNNLGPKDSFLGVQFLPEIDEPRATNKCFRERGALYLHITENIKDDYTDRILDRADALKDKLRNATIDKIRVLSHTPPNFQAGATLRFEGGFQSASMIVQFYSDDNL